MIDLLKAVSTGIVFSGYYFPFEFTFLPGINTKMVLAVIGIILFVIQWLKDRNTAINRVFISISAWAAVFSLFSLFSVTYNNTTDYTYASYIIKMWVWLSGAYAVLYLMREVHGEISLKWVFHYMAWVCAAQSLLAIIIDTVPVIQNWVDAYILQDIEFLHRTKRLYGIGAFFDTAGIRFSCALLGLGYLLVHNTSVKREMWYWGLFLVIGILGNIVSRTTTIGLIIAFSYLAFTKFSLNMWLDSSQIKLFINIIVVIGLVAGITFYCYRHFPAFRNYLQYGFEGFVNWYKTGDWSTGSTDRLQSMFVLPDNLKTWLIGDGWFVNPNDPNGFYKYTDIGYLRFIFYCGSIGLCMFVFFFIYCTYDFIRKWKENTFFFLLLFLLELTVWIKISTDIFVVYALLLLLDKCEPTQNSPQAPRQLTL